MPNTGWNDKIVALEKTWFHFRLMKTSFLFFFSFFFFFFVADHLLVDQLCTNPKSDRSLLSCLKVTQCSTSEIGDAPLYNSCSLPIQAMTTGLLPAPSKCKSGLPRITGMCSGWWKKNSIRLPVAGRGCGSRTRRRPTSSKRPRLGFRRSATTLYPSLTAPTSPYPNPLDYFVWSYVENITNMTSHNTKASLIAAIRRAPTGACGKGMLPLPDPYRGCDWGWRLLHWIDVSSSYLNWFFSIKVLK